MELLTKEVDYMIILSSNGSGGFNTLRYRHRAYTFYIETNEERDGEDVVKKNYLRYLGILDQGFRHWN
jgi:hypothetical protein